MGGCAGSRPAVDRNPMIIDVQQTIAEAAWRMFYFSRSRWRRMFTWRKDFTVEVPMNYFHFQVTDEELMPVENDKNRNQGLIGDKEATYSCKVQAAPQHLGLRTTFTNDTSEKQTYNFKFEKTRKTSMTVTFQKGFSIGGKANFSLGLPKILPDGKISAEIDTRVSVTKTTGETFEQTLTTSATSDIKVAEHSHYIATVVMKEQNLLADFKVWVKVSMPAQEARAMIKNKSGETIFFFKLRNLAELFPKSTHLDKDGDPRSDAVQFVVEGRVDGVQLSSHCINVTDKGASSSPDDHKDSTQPVAEEVQNEGEGGGGGKVENTGN